MGMEATAEMALPKASLAAASRLLRRTVYSPANKGEAKDQSGTTMIGSTSSSLSASSLWRKPFHRGMRSKRHSPQGAVTFIGLLLCFACSGSEAGKLSGETSNTPPSITILDPPEKEFFSKVLDFHGVPIKAHAAVSNEALYAAYRKLSML